MCVCGFVKIIYFDRLNRLVCVSRRVWCRYIANGLSGFQNELWHIWASKSKNNACKTCALPNPIASLYRQQSIVFNMPKNKIFDTFSFVIFFLFIRRSCVHCAIGMSLRLHIYSVFHSIENNFARNSAQIFFHASSWINKRIEYKFEQRLA